MTLGSLHLLLVLTNSWLCASGIITSGLSGTEYEEIQIDWSKVTNNTHFVIDGKNNKLSCARSCSKDKDCDAFGFRESATEKCLLIKTRGIQKLPASYVGYTYYYNPKNCNDVFKAGGTISRVYTIYPDGLRKVKVFCEQTIDGGGWTVFQRRIDGSTDFFLDWNEYKVGFGVPTHEYWVGNHNLHLLTANRDQRLKVELQHGGETTFADYSEFWVDNEDSLYRMHVYGYSGKTPPGDSLAYHNGYPFTTKDMDNDDKSTLNCAVDRSGAWWYKNCQNSNLNGLYNGNGNDTKGIIWYTWRGWTTSLSAVRMMIKN